MKVNTKNIGGKVVRENDTYILEDNTLLNNLTLSKTTLKPGMSTNGHHHDEEDEVYFFTKGWANMIIGDELEMAKAGDIFLVPAGKFHKVVNSHSENFTCEFICVFQKYNRDSDVAIYGDSDQDSQPFGD
tara:strand:- start:1767 stop:2156 length:390 start_codon:yes stop_codon:yes gene_type:complete